MIKNSSKQYLWLVLQAVVISALATQVMLGDDEDTFTSNSSQPRVYENVRVISLESELDCMYYYGFVNITYEYLTKEELVPSARYHDPLPSSSPAGGTYPPGGKPVWLPKEVDKVNLHKNVPYAVFPVAWSLKVCDLDYPRLPSLQEEVIVLIYFNEEYFGSQKVFSKGNWALVFLRRDGCGRVVHQKFYNWQIAPNTGRTDRMNTNSQQGDYSGSTSLIAQFKKIPSSKDVTNFLKKTYFGNQDIFYKENMQTLDTLDPLYEVNSIQIFVYPNFADCVQSFQLGPNKKNEKHQSEARKPPMMRPEYFGKDLKAPDLEVPGNRSYPGEQ